MGYQFTILNISLIVVVMQGSKKKFFLGSNKLRHYCLYDLSFIDCLSIGGNF